MCHAWSNKREREVQFSLRPAPLLAPLIAPLAASLCPVLTSSLLRRSQPTSVQLSCQRRLQCHADSSRLQQFCGIPIRPDGMDCSTSRAQGRSFGERRCCSAQRALDHSANEQMLSTSKGDQHAGSCIDVGLFHGC